MGSTAEVSFPLPCCGHSRQSNFAQLRRNLAARAWCPSWLAAVFRPAGRMWCEDWVSRVGVLITLETAHRSVPATSVGAALAEPSGRWAIRP